MTAPRDWQSAPVPQGYPSYPSDPPQGYRSGQAPVPYRGGPGPGGPQATQPLSAPPAQYSAVPAPPPVPAPRRRRSGVAVASVLGLVLLLLLGLSVAQFLALGRVGDRLDRQGRDLAAGERRSAELEERLKAVESRTNGLETKTQGTLNAAAVAKKVLPSVLRVKTPARSIGSAFAFGRAPSGGGTLLVTNYHVVESSVTAGQKDVLLERTGESYPATVIRTDPERDIAVLQTKTTFPRLSPLPGQVAPGAPVVVVGSPLGLTDSVTTGVVSAVRELGQEGGGRKVIQFDAAINAGNSGGPVINADGLVVGVAQAKIQQDGADGLGFAIPIDQVCGDLVSC